MVSSLEDALSDSSFKYNEFKENEFVDILNSADDLCECINAFLPIQITSGRRNADHEEAGDIETDVINDKLFKTFGKASRAKTIEELHKRIELLRGKKASTYKEKLLKKGLKNRLKKKQKLEERKQLKNSARKQDKTEEIEADIKEEESEVSNEEKPNIPLETDIQYNKIILSNSELEKKRQLDPKRTLQKIEKANKKLQKLELKGKKEKLLEIKDKTSWDVAIKKAEGLKVKDDVDLLKKSVSKLKQRKAKSKKKWEDRENAVKQKKEDAQKKREGNINKKKQERAKKRKKVLLKKGRILPR